MLIDQRHLLMIGVAWLNLAASQAPAMAQQPGPAAVPNVVLVTLDGLRWQEVFAGADETLLDKEAGGVKDLAALQERFWRESPEARREALLPFFWSTLATQGVVFGNPEADSRALVTNGLNFSYPGYSELLCGFADPAIDSNAKQANVNVTVLEWLHGKPGMRGRVAAFCSWDVFPFIINEQRSGIPVNAGWEPLAGSIVKEPEDASEAAVRNSLAELDELTAEVPRLWPDVRYDYFTFRGAEAYVRGQHPRVMYVSLGETDDWAHAGRYDLYLDAAHRNDQYIKALWETIQSLPEYRNNTTLIVTTDHGRGDNRVDWKSHGKEIADCQYIWMAVLGPGVTRPASLPSAVTQSQIAATVAACLGYDYCVEQPRTAPPLPVMGERRTRLQLPSTGD